jgi:hypothetical protein
LAHASPGFCFSGGRACRYRHRRILHAANDDPNSVHSQFRQSGTALAKLSAENTPKANKETCDVTSRTGKIHFLNRLAKSGTGQDGAAALSAAIAAWILLIAETGKFLPLGSLHELLAGQGVSA